MIFHIKVDLEKDGRFIADIPELPGVSKYGKNKNEAIRKALVLAFKVLSDQVYFSELVYEDIRQIQFLLEEKSLAKK